jgi:carbon storage regulator
MLVLTRKKNESIVIDGRISIEVLQIKGKTIRLGISAPDDIKILRGELNPFTEIEATIEMKSKSDPQSRVLSAHAG